MLEVCAKNSEKTDGRLPANFVKVWCFILNFPLTILRNWWDFGG